VAKNKPFWQDLTIVWKYAIAVVLGLVVGFKTIPTIAVAIFFLLIAVIAVFKAFKNDFPGFLTILPFAIYTEVFIRANERWVPYLTLQYVLVICFSLFLLNGVRNSKVHFQGYFFLALFVALEFLNNIYPDKPQIGRPILVNSLALLLVTLWGSRNVLTPMLINKFLTTVKIATIFLTGVVLVSHLQGKIDYGTISNSDASNGMAPVQLSGYLGAGCALFFLSIMNPEEVKTRLVNMGLLVFAATVMLLTFSRGGLYFLLAVVGLFFFYNRSKMASYFKFIFLVPVAFVIYSYVVKETGGKIVERYGQEGASSREVLVSIGFELFIRNPVTGVGTGNYNTRIVTEKLFQVESGAHNEFVRAAAEHGVIGLVLYWGFFVVLFLNILRRPQPQQQYAMYFFILFCLITVHNGLKISLQPFLLLLAVATTSVAYHKKRQIEIKELPKRALVSAG
jgi:O-antigen ligase